eukprot:564015-Alexandrium_andersonii.AAC.1
MLTVCGAQQWANLALRVVARAAGGRAQSEGPPMRGTVLEASLGNRPAQRSASTSAASSSRAPKR